jgi:hypothetical protein
VPRTWVLARVLLELLVAAEGDLPLCVLEVGQLVLVLAGTGNKGSAFLESGIPRKRVATAAFHPRVVVVFKLLV